MSRKTTAKESLRASARCYSQVRSGWQTLEVPQSAVVKHSTQARFALWQMGVAGGQSALVPQTAEQACPLEQDGVALGQSALARQATQV
jgi:hypothetical protein